MPIIFSCAAFTRVTCSFPYQHVTSYILCVFFFLRLWIFCQEISIIGSWCIPFNCNPTCIMYFSNNAKKKKEMRKRIATKHLIASEHFKREIHHENVYLYGSHCWCLLYKEHWTNDDWICYKLEKYNKIERMTERERQRERELKLSDYHGLRLRQKKRTETHNRVFGFSFFFRFCIYFNKKSCQGKTWKVFKFFNFNLIKNTFNFLFYIRDMSHNFCFKLLIH